MNLGETSLPTPAAIELVEGLAASRMGVDRHGNLWAWNERSGFLQVVSPSGELVTSRRLENVQAVDFDAEWGVVAVERPGRTVAFHAEGKTSRPSLTLTGDVGDIVWIDGQTIAVAPLRAAHQVELWSTATAQRLETLGQLPSVPDEPGLVLLHRSRLVFDHDQRLLFALEGFSGKLGVYLRGGSAPRYLYLQPRKDDRELQEWMEAQDREAREKGERREIFLSRWSGFTLGIEDDVWIPRRCESASKGQAMTLQRISRTDEDMDTRISLDRCCSTTLVRWGDRLIVYRESRHPQGQCVEAIPVPTFSQEVIDAALSRR